MKAQTAMEYLITYGWAILIVILVVAALYTMGVFGFPDETTRELCQNWCKNVSTQATQATGYLSTNKCICEISIPLEKLEGCNDTCPA